MKWTMRCAALLAALVLALGLVTIIRPGAAAADEDTMMLMPPRRTMGDPDDSGPSHTIGVNRASSFVGRVVSFFRASGVGRTSQDTLRPSAGPRQSRAARR